jgi:glycosyltransferase involved in cell wall biosynthesis
MLGAAKFAPELSFRVVGSGQLEPLLEERPDNVEWVPWVEYRELRHEHARAGVALGIFGTSSKAARVIPNKAFQALACGTPLVTADTPAARELLTDGKDAVLVPPGDPAALADALRRLATDDDLRTGIGLAGLTTYKTRASEDVLGHRWRDIIERAAA